MKIIKPTTEEVPFLVEVARELHGLGIFGEIGPEFDWPFAIWNFNRANNSMQYYVRCAVDDNGIHVGAIVGHIDTFFFSRKFMGLEDGWYVREGTPSRASIAMQLMRGFIDWALDEKGALLVQTGDIAAINSHAVDTLYRHMGFKRFGTVYKFQRNR